MNEKMILQICSNCFDEEPGKIERCAVGQGNYVYIVEYINEKYVIRCSEEYNAYENAIYWLEKLKAIDIPVPQIIGRGKFEIYEYLILTYIEGKDIGLVYSQLNEDEKRAIAKEIVHIQNKVASLELHDVATDWTWREVINDTLERARERIIQNGYYFQVEKVEALFEQSVELEDYFASIKPIAYLDDISSKNLLINNGKISGIIDIDWMGIGDKLTYVALTNMALLNMEYDTNYINRIKDEEA